MPTTRSSVLAALGAGAGVSLSGCATVMGAGREADADVIEVSAPLGSQAGRLRFGGLDLPCMLGRTGIRLDKHEGDGGTPAGLYPLLEVRYRPDVFAAPPPTGLPCFRTDPMDGWCDDPGDLAYNKLVRLPYTSDCENMWRKDDHLYDVLAVIGYNCAPVIPGAGSAIFLHIARQDGDRLAPTTGCVSLAQAHVLAVLARCAPATRIRIRLA